MNEDREVLYDGAEGEDEYYIMLTQEDLGGGGTLCVTRVPPLFPLL